MSYTNSDRSLSHFKGMLDKYFSNNNLCNFEDTKTMLSQSQIDYVDKKAIIEAVEGGDNRERDARQFVNLMHEYFPEKEVISTSDLFEVMDMTKANTMDKKALWRAVNQLETPKPEPPKPKLKPQPKPAPKPEPRKPKKYGKPEPQPEPELPINFIADVSFEDSHPTTMFISCSDGRFTQAKKEFLERGLGIANPDEVTIPGGPARILLSGTNFFAVQDDIKMLAKAHGTKRVIAIAHHDCAYYKAKYPRDAKHDLLDKRERADLIEFLTAISTYVPGASVEIYFADVKDGRVVFRKVQTE